LGIGDWGLGIGDWGLGPIPNPQSPIPNPQSPLKRIFKNYSFILILTYLFELYLITIIKIKSYNEKKERIFQNQINY